MENRATGMTEASIFEILAPSVQTVPLVLTSPHSGSDYPDDFLRCSRLDPLTLRASEDAFVDELFDSAPGHGAPLLRALFPRAFVDANRERLELDPAMFQGRLPRGNKGHSPRVTAGLGTIARVVANGEAIYDHKLPLDEAMDRLARCYDPFHEALAGLIDATRAKFGCCILVDCHSMPSLGEKPPGHGYEPPADFVLGDRFGKSCSQVLVDLVDNHLHAAGFEVKRNIPYAGGFITRHYGAPATGVHAMQIEINRALYMDEATVTRDPKMVGLKSVLDGLVAALAALDPASLAT